MWALRVERSFCSQTHKITEREESQGKLGRWVYVPPQLLESRGDPGMEEARRHGRRPGVVHFSHPQRKLHYSDQLGRRRSEASGGEGRIATTSPITCFAAVTPRSSITARRHPTRRSRARCGTLRCPRHRTFTCSRWTPRRIKPWYIWNSPWKLTHEEDGETIESHSTLGNASKFCA